MLQQKIRQKSLFELYSQDFFFSTVLYLHVSLFMCTPGTPKVCQASLFLDFSSVGGTQFRAQMGTRGGQFIPRVGNFVHMFVSFCLVVVMRYNGM